MQDYSEQVFRMAARGWRLFPVRVGGKQPLIGDWPHQATSSEARLRLWLNGGNCNWAAATGPDSGIFVLDVDGEQGQQSVRDLEGQGCVLPNTLKVRTGRGEHIYFNWPPNGTEIRNSAGKIARGLDVRGAGGYVLVPPSVHPSGIAYEFFDKETPIAPAPRWLLERLAQPFTVPAVAATIQTAYSAIPEGQRNTTLASLAGTMRGRGMTLEALEAALLAENANRCVPLLAVQEVKAIARSVSRYEPASAECPTEAPSLSLSRSIMPDEPSPNLSALPLPQGWHVRDLSDAIAGTGQQPPWIIRDLLLAQSATQVSAHPHSMKSLAWLAACLESVVTHKVWGHFDASAVNSALFVETEDSTWVLEERIRGIAKGLGVSCAEDAPGFHYLRTGPFDLVNMGKDLTQIIDCYKPDFAVLSTLQNLLHGRDWTRQNEMQDVNALIVRLSDRCPIVEITHSPWDTRSKRAIGTVSQAANFLTALHFEKKVNGGDTFVHVSVDSKLGADVTDFTLKLETEGEGKEREVRRFVYEGPGWPKGLRRDAVVAALNEDPVASAKEIAERTGVSARYVQQIKKSMDEQVE
jgi:hypothetical protein